MPAEEWAEFVAMRKAMRATMTPGAVRITIAKLAKLAEAGHDPKAVLEQSIANGYRGVFPLKEVSRAAENHSARHHVGRNLTREFLEEAGE